MKNKKTALYFLICYLGYTSIYIARLNLSAASPAMMEAGCFDARQYGALGTVFAVVYACGRLFNGALGDKLPPYLMLGTGLAGAAVSNALISLLPPYVGILFLWGLNAYAQSMLWSSVLRLLGQIYPPDKARHMSSYMVTAVCAGNIIGILLCERLVEHFGAPSAFLIPAAISALFSTLILLLMRHLPDDTAEHTAAPLPAFSLVKKKEIRTALVPAFLHGLIKDNISHWMLLYLVAVYGVDTGLGALAVIFVPVCGFVGRLTYPAFFRLCHENEHTVSRIQFAICTAAGAFLLLSHTWIGDVIALGVLYAAISIVNTTVTSVFPSRFRESGNVASVSGLMDFVSYLGYGVGSFLIGWAVKAGFGYQPMLIGFAVISALSLAFVWFCYGRKKA